VLHRPYHAYAADESDNRQNGTYPSIPNSMDYWSSNNTTNAREDISNEVVHSNASRRSTRHELGQHRGRHAEDQHASNAEEEISNDL
jgi:hypothetical protein